MGTTGWSHDNVKPASPLLGFFFPASNRSLVLHKSLVEMARRGKAEAKIDLEEEDRTKSLVFENSSDDDEANEDLSLEIVEKARKRKREEDLEESDRKSVRSDGIIDISSLSPSYGSEFIEQGGDAEDLDVEILENGWKFESKRKREVDLRGSERKSFETDEVIDLDLSPSDEVEFVSLEDAAVQDPKKKIKRKMKSKKKKKEQPIEDKENFVRRFSMLLPLCLLHL